MGDTPSSRPYRVDVDHGVKDMILFNNRRAGNEWSTVHNKSDIETRSTHIGGNDIAIPKDLSEMQGTDDAARGAGSKKRHRTIRCFVRREGTSYGIHNQERTFQTRISEPGIEICYI